MLVSLNETLKKTNFLSWAGWGGGGHGERGEGGEMGNRVQLLNHLPTLQMVMSSNPTYPFPQVHGYYRAVCHLLIFSVMRSNA